MFIQPADVQVHWEGRLEILGLQAGGKADLGWSDCLWEVGASLHGQ